MVNTIGQANNLTAQGVPNAPLNFTLWQPHFDRDFASVMELLSIPLYGPSTLTLSLAPRDISNNNITLNNLVPEAPLPPTQGPVPPSFGYYQPLIAQSKLPARAGR